MGAPLTYTFDIPNFRIDYPAFSNATTFPDVTLQLYWDNATCYIDNLNYGYLNGDCRYQALTLMTAHLASLSVLIASGQIPGLVQTSTIDKISVGLTPPPLLNQFQWWLCITPYGQSLLALLQVSSVGGFYIGGLPERLAIRKVGGTFRA